MKYLADEHGAGRTYRELADELNAAILQWADGDSTSMMVLGLDRFLESRGYTRERVKTEYEAGEWPFDEEQVRRLVKYFWTKE